MNSVLKILFGLPSAASFACGKSAVNGILIWQTHSADGMDSVLKILFGLPSAANSENRFCRYYPVFRSLAVLVGRRRISFGRFN